MKVVHIVSFINTGAGRAAKRISTALREEGIDSCIYTLFDTEESYVKSLSQNRLQNVWFHLKNAVNLKMVNLLSPSEYFTCDYFGMNILSNPEIREADVIHLHWVNEGILPYRAIRMLKARNKKVVWTLHDMQAFTGGCHYNGSCLGYMENCSNCPIINRKRVVARIHTIKREAISNWNISIVGCSEWITDCAKNSSVMRERRCLNIPNCINIGQFKPMDSVEARRKYNIPTNKKVILFGALSSTSDPRKGFSLLREALELLNNDSYICCVFGGQIEDGLPMQSYSFGTITKDKELATIYNMADVFVAPSLQENLANTVVESLACGVPVTAFNVGGMKDMVVTGQTGYLAKAGDVHDLAEGIQQCIDNERKFYLHKCREFAKNKFSNKVVASRYHAEYERLLHQKENTDL